MLKKSPRHEDVVGLLHDHIHNYDKIGQLLGVPFAKRDAVRIDPATLKVLLKMNIIVNIWIDDQTSDVTWEHFIGAMEKGELRKLAGEIIEFTEQDKTKQDYADVPEWVRRI